MPPIDLGDVRAAAARIAGVVHRTPVLRSRTLDGQVGGEVILKAEGFQRTGSFKLRGAYNAIDSMADDQRVRGVIAFSSGNHAAAVALAARTVGTRAVIVMPHDAPAGKVAATRGYGAEIVSYDRYTGDREAIARELAADHGLTLVPPFDDPLVMAGQGTVALELLDQIEAPDMLIAPIGGGGLIAGCATVAAALAPGMRIVGVEPDAGDDTRRSLAADERVRIEVPRTIADGLQVQSPGALTFEVNRRLVDEVVTVSDAEIVEAMAFLFERLKIVVEPSGAVGVAALLSGRVAPARPVAVVLSGANISADRFAQLVGGDRPA